jgi:hypothetical protein
VPGSVGWLWRLELQPPALFCGARAGARCALAVGNPRCSTIALTPAAPFTYANTLKPASTPQAREHIQGERPFQQPGPVQTGCALLPRLLHRRGKGGALLRKPWLRPCLREQKWTHFRAWGKDAVEPRQVCPRRRHQAGQPAEQRKPGEEQMRRAVRQRALHARSAREGDEKLVLATLAPMKLLCLLLSALVASIPAGVGPPVSTPIEQAASCAEAPGSVRQQAVE